MAKLKKPRTFTKKELEKILKWMNVPLPVKITQATLFTTITDTIKKPPPPPPPG